MHWRGNGEAKGASSCKHHNKQLSADDKLGCSFSPLFVSVLHHHKIRHQPVSVLPSGEISVCSRVCNDCCHEDFICANVSVLAFGVEIDQNAR